MHRVNPQETVASIANKYKVSEKSISEANSNSTVEPQAGDLLLIPVGYPGPEPVFTAASYSRYRRAANGYRRSATQTRKPAVAPAARPGVAASKPGAKPNTSTAVKKPADATKRPAAPANRASARGPASLGMVAVNLQR
jgi:hypothetical protein